ncbi:nitrate reductase molybdenum cofactor assembly chaperone [Nocardia sp. NPDC050697]|uniref:nitrate reductase molybdenum cofactor assembly chaperone n=1 Tax=Nocardia sp. NPDC050697 TaxID=3155158 RepID=UPI0033D8C7F1
MRPAFHQAVAHCLDYPDLLFYERIPLLAECAPALRPFLGHAASVPLGALAEEYVRVFDFHNRHCLHLTWWLDGDTRRRGESLLRLKGVYRAAGLELVGSELPDYLPLVLEYVAATGDRAPLLEHRPALELLRFALAEAGTAYSTVLEALCAALPGPSPRDRAAARALAAAGPRGEEVGLVPYGHPELLPLTPVGPAAQAPGRAPHAGDLLGGRP